LGGARHDEAADHFTAAINSGAFSTKSTHEIYEDLIVVRQDDAYIILFITEHLTQLFGWDLKSLWGEALQKRCHALLRAGKFQDAVKSYRYMMDNIDEKTKASYLEWSNGESGVRNIAQATMLTCISLSFHGRMQRSLS
jgi:hypothetical protein